MSFYSERIFPTLCARAVQHYDLQRQEVVGQACGRVLEIGVGVGSNFEFYSDRVTEVVGLENSRAMLEKSRKHAATVISKNSRTLPQFTLVEGCATALDFEDNSFDTVVAFLVFCSVDDPMMAAREAQRVLKPEGKFLFFEHVSATDAGLRKWQSRLNPLWNKIACGCNLTRDTRRLFEKAGFQFQQIREFIHPETIKLTSHKIQGVCTKSVRRMPPQDETEAAQ